jgi:IS30 family transposase
VIIIYKQLTDQERDLIGLYAGRSLGVRAISRLLNRHVSTISREMKRNSFKGKYYTSINARCKAASRKSVANSHLKIKSLEWLQKHIWLKLRSGWSPEQIAGRLRFVSGKTIVCHETIYSYIYSKKNSEPSLKEYLTHAHKKRRKHMGRQVRKCRIDRRVSIHNRPESVNTRTEFGHWEDDTVEGCAHKDGVHTTLERMSRYYVAKKINSISSSDTIKVQLDIFSPLPVKARRSATHDNGRENHKHYQLIDVLNMDTYFADPYSSWQRGSNENANGLLRRYFPKGTDFAKVDQKDIDEAVREINNLPRKCLGYNTAQEVFTKQLACCTSR